jgi:hypothetical protein
MDLRDGHSERQTLCVRVRCCEMVFNVSVSLGGDEYCTCLKGEDETGSLNSQCGEGPDRAKGGVYA